MAQKVKDPGFGYATKHNAKGIISDTGTSNVLHINKKEVLVICTLILPKFHGLIFFF